MANYEPNYFGLQLGDALANVGKSVGEGYSRRGMLQAKQAEMDKDRQRQAFMDKMALATQGLTPAEDVTQTDVSPLIARFEEMNKQRQMLSSLGLKKTQAEIDLANKRAEMVGRPNLPRDFRATPTGMEPIPGSMADIKLKDAQRKKIESARSSFETANIAMGAADKALKQVDWSSTGFIGNMTKGLGGSDAANLEETIKPISAILGFDTLKKMRQESPTGGALGNVSDRELALLTAAVSSLSQKQSPSQLRESLMRVKTHLANWKANQERAIQAGVLKPDMEFPQETSSIFDQDKIAEMEAAILRGE